MAGIRSGSIPISRDVRTLPDPMGPVRIQMQGRDGSPHSNHRHGLGLCFSNLQPSPPSESVRLLSIYCWDSVRHGSASRLVALAGCIPMIVISSVAIILWDPISVHGLLYFEKQWVSNSIFVFIDYCPKKKKKKLSDLGSLRG
ncbi:hypothetical protein ASPBRDRAFT_414541 [Aspergillus brasiliensis CBS 101740]|uniref:Uncharacterized protein n=1 Tax=Aspergillus brasiliensis (strain CBS 101740 / IMI 381727 / IBT 21946) TaxID=767769 RepID=A0A1L9UY05_ASPBC|nr:hypothetical protein ASPBRDRAFT_414541 [Aspergillus brasiliensis CBS 101740]